MLQKIISIKDTGRFQNSADGTDTTLRKQSFIFAANGHGKTTICSILRSAKSGDPSHILGRARLGATLPPTVDLLIEKAGKITFNGTTWNGTLPNIAIFDQVYVTENIHAGDVVDTDQKQGLYRVIVGQNGVQLADQEASLAADSRAKTTEISNLDRTLKTHLPSGMKLDVFMDLPKLDDIEEQIATAEAKLKTVGEAATIKAKSAMKTFDIPVVPSELADVLALTIDDIAEDAERQITDHFAAHGMDAIGARWITEGLEHAAESCPFCAQNLKGLPLVSAYKSVFSDTYRSLHGRVNALRHKVDLEFGQTGAANVTLYVEQYAGATEFWSSYIQKQMIPDAPAGAASAMTSLAAEIISLLDQKLRAPLERVTLKSAEASIHTYEEQRAAVESFNQAISVTNTLIAAKKLEAGDGNTTVVKADLDCLKAIRTRHSEKVASVCEERAQLVAAKAETDAKKEAIRQQLEAHTAKVIDPYERRINELLDDFNCEFRITKTQHSFPAGVASSSYQLIINNKGVDLGSSKTPISVPSFRNTLSAGDKSTLALAFFIADFERTRDRHECIVVFDDPFNSQDAFRRRQTVHKIMKVASLCSQVIVLSHDPTFLKQLWDKSKPAERASISITDFGSRGSKIRQLDLDKSTQGRTATDIDDLLTYHNERVGQTIDIARKMRVVLETHLLTTFPSAFPNEKWLGDMLKNIRDGGADHPAAHLYDNLTEINDCTDLHHGEDLADTTPDQLDRTELAGLVKKTLKIVNSIQA